MMTDGVKETTAQAWDEIVDRVLEPLDLDDVGVRYAVSRWREHAEKVRGVADAGEVAYAFSSEEVLGAAVEFLRAGVAEHLAIFRAKRAQNDCQLKMMNLRMALGQSQGIFVDEEGGERIVPELLSVLRISRSAKTKMLRQVVQASMAMAQDNGDENAEPVSWPSGLGDSIQDYADELREFLDEAGDQGRDIVSRVCHDADYAKIIRNTHDVPRCIKFLAQIVAETQTNNCLRDKNRKIGFGSR